MAEAVAEHETVVRERIRHVLAIYPRVSRSMLQVGIGTSMPPVLWKPVLDKMIEDGEVTSQNTSYATPAGRHNSYEILQLASLVVTVTPVEVVSGEAA